MSSIKIMALAGAVGLLSGCGTTGSTQEPPLKPIAGNPESAESCPALGSRNWSARLTRSGGATPKLTLTIDGEVDLPTPGHTPVWKTGISDRANPPGMQILLSFDPPSPDDMVAQVVSINRVHYEVDVAYSRYRYIMIRCGNAALVNIPEVQVQP